MPHQPLGTAKKFEFMIVEWYLEMHLTQKAKTNASHHIFKHKAQLHSQTLNFPRIKVSKIRTTWKYFKEIYSVSLLMRKNDLNLKLKIHCKGAASRIQEKITDHKFFTMLFLIVEQIGTGFFDHMAVAAFCFLSNVPR